jgi:short-subunit dehydrogenase
MAVPIENTVIAITGASSGIGRATALKFAERGARLVLIARREHALQQLAEECRRRGGQAIASPADVADEAAVQRAAQEAVDAFGRIDAWINNAGVTMLGKFEDCPSLVYRRVIETNLFGYIHGARAAMPVFRRQGRGTLVNVASMNGKFGAPYASAYTASKFAIVGWSESLRMELRLEKADEIHVCTILPASIDTPLFQHAANYSGRAVKAMRPVYRPEKVAAALLRVVRWPRREVIVGTSARIAILTHALAPAGVERMAANMVDRDHFAPRPAPNSEGNVFLPSEGFDTASGGWKEAAQREAARREEEFGVPRFGH